MATVFDEMLGIGDPDDWERMRELNRPCDDCSCCSGAQCAGAEEFDDCGEKGCPCTAG